MGRCNSLGSLKSFLWYITYGVPISCFHILSFGKLSSGHRTGKGQFSFQSQRNAMPKQCSKFSKLGFNSTCYREHPCSSWISKRQRNERSNRQHLLDHRKKQENSRKTSTSASLTTLKPLTMWITTNCGKFLKRRGYQTNLPASGEICKQVKKQQLELDMEQQTGSKLGKEYIKAVYCHLAYLTFMQSTSWKMPNWMQHKLDLRLPGEISITWDMQMTPPLWQKHKGAKEPLNKDERGEWKSWLKTQHSKNEDHGIQSHHFMANRWENNGNSDRLYFWVGGSKITVDGDCSHEIKRCLLFGRKVMTNLKSILKNRDITNRGLSS